MQHPVRFAGIVSSNKTTGFFYFIVSNDNIMSHIRAAMAISEPGKHNDVIIAPV